MTITMRNACLNRERIINAVRMEIVGPSAINENAVPLLCRDVISFKYPSRRDSYG